MNIIISAIIIVIIALLIVLLLGPFRLYFNLGKEDTYLQILYKISFLGFTLKAGEMPSMQPEAEKGAAENQKHREAITSEASEANESESGKIADKEDGTGAHRKPGKMQPETEVRLIIDALPQIAQILIYLIKSINIRKFLCNISFGLDDPVDTAMVSGYLWSIVFATGIRGKDISIEPRFDGAQLQGSILTVLEARMLWFVVAAAKALEEEKTRRLIIKLVKGELH